jgi:hypothetical protein
MKKIFLITFFLIWTLSTFGQSDTMFIIVRGDFNKNDKFRLKTPRGIIDFGYANSESKKIPIYIDSTIKPFQYINGIHIIKSTFFKPYNNLKYYFFYNPSNKYIHIYYLQTSKRKGIFHIYYLPFIESIYLKQYQDFFNE